MKNQTKIEEVAHIDISLIDDFAGHPFTVKDDESMEELARSIEENGILNPIIVRKKDGGRYEIIAREVGESRNQIQRYIRLNELTPELLEFVDDSKIGLRPAVEISFLTEDEQRDLVDFIDAEGVFPSHAQNDERLPA